MKYNREAENYKVNENNIFSEYKTEDELRAAYRKYVNENGTSFFINKHFTERMMELDFMEFGKLNVKSLLEKRLNEIGNRA